MTREYIPADMAERIRAAARHRCGYCLSPQHLVMAKLHIEHIIPIAAGGATVESNLWLACPICNGHKAGKITGYDPETGQDVPLFNPRTQNWHEQFRWNAGGLEITGLTPTGRATVNALQLNTDADALLVRSYWISAGWHPPTD